MKQIHNVDNYVKLFMKNLRKICTHYQNVDDKRNTSGKNFKSNEWPWIAGTIGERTSAAKDSKDIDDQPRGKPSQGRHRRALIGKTNYCRKIYISTCTFEQYKLAKL